MAAFNEYIESRAKLVNKALDEAVPLIYPEVVTESMRCALAAAPVHHSFFLMKIVFGLTR